MRRSFVARYSLSVTVLAALALQAPNAHAALVTDVADAAEPDSAIDINLDFGWRRESHSATIGREESNGNDIYNASELSYSRVKEILDAGLTIGIYHDLELHFRAPYIVSDQQTWNYAVINGQSVERTSTIANNTQNADGNLLATPQPLMTIPGVVNRGGFGDPSVGFAWGIFNEARDSHLPDSWYPNKSRTASWTFGVDYTIPLAPVMNPSTTTPGSPNAAAGSEGEGAHKIDIWTAMSKRYGWFEPYFRLHFTLAIAASNAYSNCQIAGKDPNFLIMSQQGQEACSNTADPYWVNQEGLQPSQIGGLTTGIEFHPVDHGRDGAGLTIGIQLKTEYVSKGRNYSELSDELQKLTYTDQYFIIEGKLTFDVRFFRYIHWLTYLTVGTDTTHFITDEVVGVARGGDAFVHLDDPTANEVNPSYDFRLDAPGHRFLAMDVIDYTVASGLGFNF